MSDLLFFNGINAATGEYLIDPMGPDQLSKIIQGQPVDEAQMRELKSWYDRMTQEHYAVKEGIDPKDLSQSGWGVIFPFDCDKAIIDALRPLLDFRKSLAGDNYREYIAGEGYRPGENKNAWLTRHGAGPGPADPAKVPYYLLLVGDPEKIPYRFQTQIDVQYAVGRICFDTVEEYANYAQSVVEAEKQQLKLPRKMSFFGVANPDDPATRLSSDQLILPLVDTLSQYTETGLNNWQYQTVMKEAALKSCLNDLIGGKDTPALLFTGSHGMGFPNGDPRQLSQQGSLLCQDWPGMRQWRKPIPEDFYFSANDLSADAKVWGLISFFFACYGAGTPANDEYSQQVDSRAAIAPKSFIARLPQKMLSHPKGGALAVLGHVERAWGYSFVWGKAGRQLAVFESTLRRLMEGHPVGSAFEYFNQRYAELSSDLTVELEEVKFGKEADPYEISGMWTSNNDARNYAILGDPAVRLMVADGSDGAPVERPVIVLSDAPAADDSAEKHFSVLTVEETKELTVPVEVPPIVPEVAVPAPVIVSQVLPDSAAPAASDLTNNLQQFIQQLGGYLSDAIAHAGALEVRTYTSNNMGENNPLSGAQLKAYSVIKVDGSVEQAIPMDDSGIDQELWTLHMAMVKEAQAGRMELLRSAVAVAASLANMKGG